MNILIAEDDITSRIMLKNILEKQGYNVLEVSNGVEAWEIMQQPKHPRLLILDWLMPEMDGIELCKRIRAKESKEHSYIILLTSRDTKEDIALGLNAGANDYIGKPYYREELQARISVGVYTLELQTKLEDKICELEDALLQIKTLQGIISICSFCKKIHTGQDSWEQLEEYITKHSEAQFSHGICPDCLQKHYPKIADKILTKLNATVTLEQAQKQYNK